MPELDGGEGGGQLLRSGVALAGGTVRIPAVTGHVRSSLALLDTFGFELTLDESDPVPTATVE